MALVQMRTPDGSYSMVDENLVPVYQAEGWVLTSDLPEFKTKNVTYYDEARKTVTTTKGEEKPVEEVIAEPTLPERDIASGVTTLSDRAQQNRNYTDAEWKALVNAPIEQKLEMIKNNAANGLRLTSSQKYYLDKNFGQINSSDINTAQTEGKSGVQQPGAISPLKPGQAGYGIDTWYEFLGYGSEDEAMRDFLNGKLTRAQIRRAEAEVQPDPADVLLDVNKVKTTYGIAESDWARATPPGQKYLSLLNTINAIENSDFGRTVPGQELLNDLKTGTEKDITVSGGGVSNPNLGSGENADEVSTGGEVIVTGGEEIITGDGTLTTGDQGYVGTVGSNQLTVFNNIPTGARVFDVDGDYYLGYLVPGGDGTIYTGSIYMMYQVPNNDFVKAGLLTDASAFKGANSFLTKEDFNTGGAIYAGTTVELEGIEGNPFAHFVEMVSDNLSISPWLGTADGLALAAETALEGRDPTPGEYKQLKWYQTTTEEQRAWYELSMGRGFNNLPLDAQQAYEDTRMGVKDNLIALGISGGFDPTTGQLRDLPQGLVDYIAKKSVTGEWSSAKTNEQLRLFADPFAAGERDDEFFSVIETGGYQIDRQTQYEDTVRQEALKWLGPVAGNYNANWVANWASRIRSGEADAYEQLQKLLKQQRVALFDAYTNPELTYDDISQPWKNIVENAWGEIPDESQTYFQDIVKNNNVTYANEVLTKVGLEKGNDKVVNDALNTLEQSIGQGTVRRSLGANT